MIGKHMGRYRILKELGAGGMGRVYLAEDLRLWRRVALKVLYPEIVAHPESRQRFLNEARAASALSHPHILAIYDIAEADSLDFIVMEFVEGPTLRDRLADSGPLPPRVVALLGTQLASALAHAHEAGIIHRDIKPDNIKLTRGGQVKILDFGLAKLRERNLPTFAETAPLGLTRTAAGRIMGSPHYMSPEQARGVPCDERSDLFSLGAVLYELTTGAEAFPGESLFDIMDAIVRQPVPPLRRSAPDVPIELERIVSRCVEKNPIDRYQEADELLVDLRRLHHKLDAAEDSLGPWQATADPRKAGATGAHRTPALSTASPADRTGTSGLHSAQRVSLFLFQNDTKQAEDDWLEHALPTLLGFSLLQDPWLFCSEETEYPRMREMGMVRAGELTLPLLRKLAEEAHSQHFVTGAFRVRGEGLTVSAALFRTKNASEVARREISGRGSEAVLSVVDALCAWLRESLGIPTRHLEEYPCLPVAEIGTRNITALRAKVEANIAIGLHRDWAKGIELLQSAVAEDPRFAWAENFLHVALLAQNRGEESKRVLRSLMKNRHRLPERTRFEATMAYHRVRQEPERVLQVARQRAELYPHDPDACTELAAAHRFLDQVPEEFDAMKRACELAPERPQLQLSFGMHLLNRGHNEEALTQLGGFARAYPDSVEGATSMGLALSRLGRFEEARAEYERALAIEPDSVATRTHLADLDAGLGRFSEAQLSYEEALEDAETPEQRAQIRSSLTSLFYRQGRLSRAIKEFQAYIDECRAYLPEISFHVRRIQLLPMYVLSGRKRDALESLASFDHELSAPWDELLPFARMSVYLELEDASRAREQLPKLETATRLPFLLGLRRWSVNLRARLLELEGRFAEAVQSYLESIELNRNQESTICQLGRCYRRWGKLQEAEETLARVLRTSPAYPDAHLETARLYRDLGRFEESADHLRAALSVWRSADPDYRPAQEARDLQESWGRST